MVATENVDLAEGEKKINPLTKGLGMKKISDAF